jgi:excisionase family DNA binding protein
MTEYRLTYTIRQAAHRLGVSETTIRRWIRADAIPAIKVGGTWLIPADDLDALLHPNPKQ